MILTILKEIVADNSRLTKESILKRELNNALLKRVLHAALDPRAQYYIRKIPAYTPEGTTSLNSVLDYLDLFKNRTVTGNDGVEMLRMMLTSLNADDAKVLELIIGKDLKCGVSESTVNKIWKGFIETTPYCRCSLLSDLKDHKDLKRGYYSQTKLDGSYVSIDFNESGLIEIYTRNGNNYNIDYFKPIVDELKKHDNLRGFQLNGECLVKFEGKLLDRKTGNGILNSVLKDGVLEEGHEIIVIVWDMVPLSDVKPKGKCAIPYSERYTSLVEALKGYTVITIAATKIVYSLEEALVHYQEQLELGEEGTVLKAPDMLWKDGTSKQQFKLKLAFDLDLLVVGFKAGKGKNAKTFGSIECKTSDGLLTVNVSGFKDAERVAIWKDYKSYIGTIMAVKSNALISNSKGEYSLFHPRFVEFRKDKTEADTLKQAQKQYDNLIKGVK